MINIENFMRGNEYQFPEHFKRENKTTQATLGYFVHGLKKSKTNKLTKKKKEKPNKTTPPKKEMTFKW